MAAKQPTEETLMATGKGWAGQYAEHRCLSRIAARGNDDDWPGNHWQTHAFRRHGIFAPANKSTRCS
eukprot:11195391-Lingulodinium_polyedra.AAC.1